jgi:hypothetical protein
MHAVVAGGAGITALVVGFVLTPTSMIATPPSGFPPGAPGTTAVSGSGPPTDANEPAQDRTTAATPAPTRQVPHGAPSSTPSSAKPSQPPTKTALALVAALTIKGRAPKTGYSRDQFGAGWRTSGGCSTRNRVLRRDISEVKVLAGTDGCTVLGGRFEDPYRGTATLVTAATIGNLDIDHVVPLSDAWQKGAQQWSRSRRVGFANDEMELLATSQSVNSAKGDGDTATWLPPNRGFRCAYVARQATIKTTYGLWVTSAEKDAMTRILAACPVLRPITAAMARRPKDSHATITEQPKATQGADHPSQGSGQGNDPRFHTCRQANAAGYGPYIRGRDPEYDWYQDRDHDGIACET